MENNTMPSQFTKLIKQDALNVSEDDKLDFICWHIKNKKNQDVRHLVTTKFHKHGVSMFLPFSMREQYEEHQQRMLNYLFETSKVQYE